MALSYFYLLAKDALSMELALSVMVCGLRETKEGKSTIVSLVYIHYLSTKELLMLNFIIPSHLNYMVYRKQLWHFSLSLLDGSSLAGVGTSTDSI